MKKIVSGFGIAVALLVLAGCNGSGVTYGTGEVHEVQTLKGLSKVLSIKPDETPKIDYAARPDLVMPANKQALPAPTEKNAADPNWPVSPEQRLANVRNAAPEVDEDGNLPVAFLTDTNKTGIERSSSLGSRDRLPDHKTGLANHTDYVRADAKGTSAGGEYKKRLQELSYSTGAKRKYLTEPPTIYRTPSANAEAGDIGITDDELAAQQKAAREADRAPDHTIPE